MLAPVCAVPAHAPPCCIISSTAPDIALLVTLQIARQLIDGILLEGTQWQQMLPLLAMQPSGEVLSSFAPLLASCVLPGRYRAGAAIRALEKMPEEEVVSAPVVPKAGFVRTTASPATARAGPSPGTLRAGLNQRGNSPAAQRPPPPPKPPSWRSGRFVRIAPNEDCKDKEPLLQAGGRFDAVTRT